MGNKPDQPMLVQVTDFLLTIRVLLSDFINFLFKFKVIRILNNISLNLLLRGLKMCCLTENTRSEGAEADI